jgi:3-hydroxybutyryl-CoA dehydrogenase
MQIKKVGVIGAGTMGNGIAHVFARSGCAVVLCDVEQRFLNRGLEAIIKNLDREVARNKISADEKASALRRIDPVTERAKLADCDFIVEAATEKFETGWPGLRSSLPQILPRSRLPSLPRSPSGRTE